MEAQTPIIAKEVIGDYNVNKNLSKLESAIIALQQQLDNAMDAKIQEEIHEELQLLLKFCGEELDISSITHKPEKKLTSEQEILSEKQKECLPTSQLLTNNTFQIMTREISPPFLRSAASSRIISSIF
jgi:hypothetical protein